MSVSDGKAIRSIAEFERMYYPKRYKKEREEEIEDLRALGVCLANESLGKIDRILGS